MPNDEITIIVEDSDTSVEVQPIDDIIVEPIENNEIEVIPIEESEVEVSIIPSEKLLIETNEYRYVKYIPQEITESQKLQARTNIGAVGIKDIHSSTFIFEQSTASAIWTITHNLSKYPSCTIVDSAETEVFGDVEYINNQSLRLTFIGAFSGKAYLN